MAKIFKIFNQDFSDTINCRICNAMVLKSMLRCPKCGAFPVQDVEDC